MHARVPQDVDLEDRLLFGLTAVRFGELAVACLAAIGAWRALPIVGGGLALLLLVAGAALAWGSWRGRGADHWVVAAPAYLARTRRIEVDRERLRLRAPRPAVPQPRPPLRVLDGTPE